MTSHQVENVHLELLNKLLSDSVLECFRMPPESTESSISSGIAEEQGPVEEEEEALPELVQEEEWKSIDKETEQEALPQIFPTPSLRLPLSDKSRSIEKQNRIHVLPEEFKTEIDPQAIPKILTTAQQKYIDILANLVGCTRYKSSLAEYWFLDTMANLLRRAQEDELDRPTQAILMLWFCEWIKEMQHFDAADRTRMMRRFQDNMLAAIKYIVETEQLPTPAQAGVYYKALETNGGSEAPALSAKLSDTMTGVPGLSAKISGDKAGVRFKTSFECCIRDLAKIIHYIFDLFSSDYQYNLVRSVFTFTPDYELIDAPYQLQNPKSLYAPMKFKPKKHVIGPKKADKSPRKDGKGTKSAKAKKVPDTEEYMALMEKKAAAERILEAQEELDMEQWNLKNTILPLDFAVTEEFFYKYWPPPTPPPIIEPVVESPKGKGKGKGKKEK